MQEQDPGARQGERVGAGAGLSGGGKGTWTNSAGLTAMTPGSCPTDFRSEAKHRESFGHKKPKTLKGVQG